MLNFFKKKDLLTNLFIGSCSMKSSALPDITWDNNAAHIKEREDQARRALQATQREVLPDLPMWFDEVHLHTDINI